MKFEISLRTECYEDLENSFLWYEAQSKELSKEFLNEIEKSFEKIRSNPLSYAKVYKNTRRALVKKFPYSIFYLVDNKKIIVFAIFHSSRNPKSLRKRL